MKSCPHCIYLSMHRNHIGLKIILIAIVIISVVFVCTEFFSFFLRIAEGLLMEPYLPGICRLYEGSGSMTGDDFLVKSLFAEYPGLLYSWENGEERVTESDYASLLLPEGSDEDHKGVSEEALDYGEDAMHLSESMQSAFLKENEGYLSKQGETAEDESEQVRDFVPAAEKSYRYRWEELTSYEDLIKAFYAVDSTTVAGEELLQAQTLLERDMRIRGSSETPQILIYHTHSREGFADSVEGDENSGILGAGAYLATLLQNRYGYNVIHNNGRYDDERDYAYSNALPAIEALLEEYPTIEVVIDLHRDEMPADRRLVMDLQGRPTAQFMFFNGLCRTKKGEIDRLENPYLMDNLALSFQMQAACNEYYPGIARRIYLKAYRYNMHLCPKTLLIELGAQNNTEEEIHNACEPLAHVLDLVFCGREPE